jgi:hypothetical protein
MTIQDINKYFLAEKYESLFFIIFGLLAFALSIYGLFFLKTKFWYDGAIPLILVGLIQVVVGTTVYLRSDADIVRANEYLTKERSKFKTEELPRMEIVNKNFDSYRNIEIILAVVGLLVVFFNYKETESFWFGLGMMLTIQSLAMLGLDFFVEQRADIYTELVKKIL